MTQGMDGRHLIDTAVFEIGFRSEDDAFARQGDLDGLIKGRLMPIVDTVFDELAPKEGVIQLDTLEIDLGETHYTELEHEFEKRLRERLGVALGEAAQGLGGRLITEPRAEFEQWQFYLVHGRFPWDADLSGIDSVDQWLERVLDSRGVGFVEMLRRSSSSGVMVRRLVNQFSDGLLSKVVGQLSATQARFAVELIRELRKSLQRGGLGQADERGLRDMLWTGFIEAQLASDGAQLPLEVWVRRAFGRSDLPRIVMEPGVFAVLLREAGDIEKRLRLGTELTAGLQRVLVEQYDQQFAPESAPRHGEQFGVTSEPGQGGQLTRGDRAKETQLTGEVGQPRTQAEPYDRTERQTISREIVRAYDLFDTLREALSRDVLDTEDAHRILEVISELMRDHPWQMLRLYRALQGVGATLEHRLARLPAPLLYHLIRSFVSLTVDDKQAEQSDLLRALDAYAGRVASRRSYYARVLEILLRHELLDLEEIVADLDAMPEPTQPSGVEPQTAESVPSEPSDASRRTAISKPSVKSFEGLSTAALRKRVKRALEAVAKSSGAATGEASERLIASLEHAIRSDAEWLGRFLEKQMHDVHGVSRLCDVLPERLLTRLLLLLRPRDHARLQHAVDMIAQTCYAGGIEASPERVDHLKWQYVFEHVLERGDGLDERSFVAGLVTYLGLHLGQPDEEGFRSFVSQRLALDVLPSIRERYARVGAAVWPERDIPLQGIATSSPPGTSTAPAESWEGGGEVAEHGYVDNAGVVLAAPYLPRLFRSLGLVGDHGFHDRAAAERAVHLIQYLVDEHTNSPEYRLTLNKVLCGIEPRTPIIREITPSEAERELTIRLLQAIVQNWKAIGNTSVAGLRESFLQRRGRLQLRDDLWHLLVEHKAYDLLLDRLPWSYSMIKYSWMQRALHVDWR